MVQRGEFGSLPGTYWITPSLTITIDGQVLLVASRGAPRRRGTLMVHRCIRLFWSFCVLDCVIISQGSAGACQLLYISLSVWSCLCQIVVSCLFSVQYLWFALFLLSGVFTACCFWIFGLVFTCCLSLGFMDLFPLQSSITKEAFYRCTHDLFSVTLLVLFTHNKISSKLTFESIFIPDIYKM